MEPEQAASVEVAVDNDAKPARKRIAPVALRPGEVSIGKLESPQANGLGKEHVDFDDSVHENGQPAGVDEANERPAPSEGGEVSDAEDEHISGASNVEPQGPLSDDQLQNLVDQLIEVELHNYEMQEELEPESLDCLRKDVTIELADQYQGDELEEAVENELALFKQYKEEDLNEGQSMAAELQEQLEDAGVFLRGIYMQIDEMWSKEARTEAWRNAQWTNSAVPERAKAVVKEVDRHLEAQRPVGKDKEGRTLGIGASGLMARKIQEVRKKSRKIEKRRAKAATQPPKQPQEEPSDMDEQPQDEESSSSEEEVVSEAEGSVSAEAVWAEIQTASSDEEDDKIAKFAKNQTEQVMLKQLVARYKAGTPEEAVRMCETIEGATEVEEIGESGGVEDKSTERLLKKAYKEEDSKGLTETQRKTMKKRGDAEDRVKAVRQRKKHILKEPKPRKPRVPQASKSKPSVPSSGNPAPTEPLGADSKRSDLSASGASPDAVHVATTEAAAVKTAEASSPENVVKSQGAAEPPQPAEATSEKSFETAREEDKMATDSICNEMGKTDAGEASGMEQDSPEACQPREEPMAEADFPPCEAADSPPRMQQSASEREWAGEDDQKTEPLAGRTREGRTSEGGEGKEADDGAGGGEIPSPSDEVRQQKEGRSSSPAETEQVGLKRASPGKAESPAVKRPRFEVPVGVNVVDLASESEEETAAPAAPVVVHLEDTEPAEGSPAEEESGARKGLGATELADGSEPPIARRTRGQLRAAMGGQESAGKGAVDDDMEEEADDSKEDVRTVEEVARDAARKRELVEGKRKVEEGPASSKEDETAEGGERPAEAVEESPTNAGAKPKFGAEATSCAASATLVDAVKEEPDVSSPVRSPRARCPDSPEKRKLKRLSELQTPLFRKGEVLESEAGETDSDGSPAESTGPKRGQKKSPGPKGGDTSLLRGKKGIRRKLLQDEDEVGASPIRRCGVGAGSSIGVEGEGTGKEAGVDQPSERPEAMDEEPVAKEGPSCAEADPPKAQGMGVGPQQQADVTPGKAEGHVTPKRDGTVEDFDSDEEMEDADNSDDAWDRKKDRELAKREADLKAAKKGPKDKKQKKRKSGEEEEDKTKKKKRKSAEEEDSLQELGSTKGERDSDGFYSARAASPSKRKKSEESSQDEESDDESLGGTSGKSTGGKKGGKGEKQKSSEKKKRKKGKKVRLGCKCTTCRKHLKRSKIQQHPVLRVTQCKRCLAHYKDATFPVGEDGWEEECQWCGDGGTLTLCTTCKKTVCKDCVVRNLGDVAWDEISDDWSCFSCVPGPISMLQEAHERAVAKEDDEDAGGGSSGKHHKSKKRKGRRNIKEIDEQLDPETQAKLKMERERLARIEQRRANTALSPLKGPRGTPRKSYGAALDEDSPEQAEEELAAEEELGDGNSGRSVIINASRESDEDPIFIDPAIAEKLKPHQVEGVRFMWENIVETVKTCAETPKEGLGCILAHSMGLGKTLQVVSLVHTLLTNQELKIRTVLIVVPVNVLRNWSSEFDKWQGGDVQKVRKKVRVYTVEDAGSKNEQRADMLAKWQRTGGAMIIGYTAFRNAVSGRTIKDEALRESFKQSLRDPGPDVLICDEAHMIKNIKADITKELKAVKTKRRVALTGSPLQNNLLEYYCMVDFVRERLLGTVKQFRNKFQNPIANGQHLDSTKKDIQTMKRRSHVLHKLLQGFVQRKDQRLLQDMLPPKSVYVISVRLSPLQRRLYQRLLDAIPSKQGKHGKNYLFQAYQSLTKVWNHPNLLQISKEKDDAKIEDTLEDAVAGDDEAAEPSPDNPSTSARPKRTDGASSEMPSVSATEQPTKTERGGRDEALEEGAVNSPLKGGGDGNRACPQSDAPRSGTPPKADETANGTHPEGNGAVPGAASAGGSKAGRRGRGRPPGAKNKAPRQPGLEIPSSWWQEEMPEAVDLMEGSGKVAITVDLLRSATAKGDKMLVFSQSLFTLDVLELALGSLPRAESGTGETWCKNREYYRLDGSTPSQARQRLVERFNDPSNTDVKCVLISTKAGSLGINLPAANRVVIFDGSWNPTHDLQAMFRAWRFGQTKPVYVYRLLACGTMEENIYARQVTKESLSARVIDEQQVANHFSNQELESLFNLAADDDDYFAEDDALQAKAEGGNTTLPKEQATAPGVNADVVGAAAAAAGVAAAAEGAVHPEKVEEAVKEAMRRGVKEFAIPEDAPPKDDVLARVLLRNRPRWIVRYHEHDVLLEDKELEHLDEKEKALAWKEHEEAAIREARPDLTPYEVTIQLLMGELHQAERNPALSEEAKRQALRDINNKIAIQRNLQAQLEMQQRYQETLARAAQAAQHAAATAQAAVPAPGPGQGHPAGGVPVSRAVPAEGGTQPNLGAAQASPLGQGHVAGGVPVFRAPAAKEGGQKEPQPGLGADASRNGQQSVEAAKKEAERARARQEHARRVALYEKLRI